jgi:hypothetical protein
MRVRLRHLKYCSIFLALSACHHEDTHHDADHKVAALPENHLVTSVKQIPKGTKPVQLCGGKDKGCYFLDLGDDRQKFFLERPKLMKQLGIEPEEVTEHHTPAQLAAHHHPSDFDTQAERVRPMPVAEPQTYSEAELTKAMWIYDILESPVGVTLDASAASSGDAGASEELELAGGILDGIVNLIVNTVKNVTGHTAKGRMYVGVPGYRVSVECAHDKTVEVGAKRSDVSPMEFREFECTWSTAIRMTATVFDENGKEVWKYQVPVVSIREHPNLAKLDSPRNERTKDLANNTVLVDNKVVIGFQHFKPAVNPVGFAKNPMFSISVTKDRRSWMNDATEMHSKSLSNWRIPGSHDAGMYKMGQLFISETENIKIDNVDDMVEQLKKIVDLLGNAYAEDAIGTLAITQENTFEQQLNLGVRAFDVRTGTRKASRSLPAADRKVFMVHGMISGGTYEDALFDTLKFLISPAGKGEVVFFEESGNVEKGWEGAPQEAKQTALKNALARINKELGADAEKTARSLILDVKEWEKTEKENYVNKGGKFLLSVPMLQNRTWEQLVHTMKKRFLIVGDIPNTWNQDAYRAGKMIEKMNEKITVNCDLTKIGMEFQMQATPNDLDFSLTGKDPTTLGNRLHFDTDMYKWMKSEPWDTKTRRHCGIGFFMQDFVNNFYVDTVLRTMKRN